MRSSLVKFLIVIIFSQLIIAQTKKLTIDDIYTNRGLRSKSLAGLKWFDNGNKFSFLKYEEGAIYEHNVKTGEEKIILGQDKLIIPEGEQISLMNYEWSSNSNYILITGLLYARTTKSGGTFYIYNVKEKSIQLIIESEKEQANVQFSPDEKKLGFVRANNIYVTDLESGEEKQLTFDGSETILNGIFDWVYEEEFSIIMGWEWAPDSKSISFWRFDQSNVPKVFITKYDSQYFTPDEQYYPKPGGNNSLVKIGVVDISTAETVWMDLGDETDIYIPRIKYTNDPSRLSIQRLNRLQNKLELLIADTETGNTKTIITETDTCWVDVYDHLEFLNDGKRFIWSSERDGFLHLYLYDLNGELINQVTKGNWEIDKLVSVDEENEIVYYTSLERSPINKDFYSIKLNGSNKKRMNDQKGTHSIDMSLNKKYFIDKYSNINTMPSTILYDVEGNEIKKLIEPDMSGFNEFDFSPIEFITFTTSDGVELNAGMIKPSNFDSTKKYPVLFDNYSGPGSQMVSDEWGFNLLQRMYAQNDYLIFWLDNRGTGGRGKSFENIVYKNLGYYEVKDIIEGAKFLISTGYVDSTRIGIMGTSYGGYVAALVILNGADYFKTAIAGAPLIHWTFYDTIYSERYMQTPSLNPEGYKKSSPLEYVNMLKGKLLIIHGMSDDNVHLQNSVVLVKALQKANKKFDMMFYPEAMHGGFGRHYLELMTEYIYENL
ncbi:MAG TPA: S9 family peptidase [Ignavibacteriaceae bacterium]|nr:S9 family peptidase [Ignavibacteriaceae bacterium]